MKGFFQTIIFISISLIIYVLFTNINFPYLNFVWNLKIDDKIIDSDKVFYNIFFWLMLILLSIIPNYFFDKKYFKKYSIFSEYFLWPILLIFWLIWIIVWILWVVSFIQWIQIIFYDIFKSNFLLDYYLWIFWIILYIPAYIYYWDNFFSKRSNKILDILIILITSLFLALFIFITYRDNIKINNNLCFWDKCFEYSDIKNISIDNNTYNIFILTNNNTYALKLSKIEMLNKNNDWIVKKWIIDIQSRLKKIINTRYMENLDSTYLNKINKLYNENNYQELLNLLLSNNIINSEDIYKASLNFEPELEWLFVLKYLYEKTNISPKLWMIEKIDLNYKMK